MQLDSIEFFYCQYVGRTPDVPQQVHDTTQAMIHHMFDSRLWLEYILQAYEFCAADGYINIENLPRHIWQTDNLIDHKKIYIHKNLTLRSAAPVFDPAKQKLVSTPYYFENIEFYSLDNLLDYAYMQLETHPSLQDRKRDKGFLKFNLQKYKTVPVPVLDYLLYLIDDTAVLPQPTMQKIGITEVSTLDSIQQRIRDLQNQDSYRIVWRQG